MKSEKTDNKQAPGAYKDAKAAASVEASADKKKAATKPPESEGKYSPDMPVIHDETPRITSKQNTSRTITSCEYLELVKQLMKRYSNDHRLAPLQTNDEPCVNAPEALRSPANSGMSFGLCKEHLNVFDENMAQQIEFSEALITDPKAGLDMTPDLDVDMPLTGQELKGNFPWKKPWDEEMSTLGRHDGGVDWTSLWKRGRFKSGEIDEFGGKQVLNTRGKTFQLSLFVEGYSLDNEHAYVVIPKIQAQVKVLSRVLHNTDDRGWRIEQLTNTVRALAYADGLSEGGESLFLDVPEDDVRASIAKMMTEDEGEEFKPPPITPTSLKTVMNETVEVAKGVWNRLGGQVMGKDESEGLLQSPGKVYAAQSIRPGELAAGIGTVVYQDSPDLTAAENQHWQQKFETDRIKKFFEIEKIKNSAEKKGNFNYQSSFNQTFPLPVMSTNDNSTSSAYAKGMMRPDGKPQWVESRGTTAGGVNQRFESLMSLMQGVLGPTAHPQKRGSSGSGSGGPPPPDDGNDGGGSGDDEGPPDWREGLPDPDSADAASAQLLVGNLLTAALRSDAYRLERANIEMEARRLAEDMLAKQAGVLAALMSAGQEENARLALEVIEAKKRLLTEQYQRDDTSDERKKDNERFQQGVKAVLELLRQAGEAGNTLGFGIPGEPMQTVGPDLYGSALFRAITDFGYAPHTLDELKCRLTPAIIWNLCGFKFGGAPDPTDPQGPVKYAGASSIMDFLKLLHKDPNKTQKSYSNAVPKREQAGFLTDAERASQRFKNIYEVVDAWETLGKTIGRIYGPRWYAVCMYCGQQLLTLYESDPELFTLDVLKYLSDLGLAFWCGQMWLQSADTSFMISNEEAAISRALGFHTATAIPGMGFGLKSTFVIHNIIQPYGRDLQIGVRAFVEGLSKQNKRALRFSSVPYGSMTNSQTTLGGWEDRASTEDGYPNPCEWDTCDVGASVDGYEMFDSYYNEDHDLGASDGKGSRIKGGQNGGRGSTGGRGGRGPAGRLQATGFRTLKLSADGTKAAFDSLPNVVGPDGKLGIMCLRFCCRNGCTSDPQHPRHRVGELCHKVHSLEFEASFVGFTWLHFMLSLMHGGFIEAIMPKAPPTDPIALQSLADHAAKMHRDKLPVPDTFLNKRALNLGGPEVDIMSYFKLGRVDNTQVNSGCKTDDIHLPGMPTFTAKDYGGHLDQRGQDSCLLVALGNALMPWGWTPDTYYTNAVQELTKTDIPLEKMADYHLYAAQVTGEKKIGLHAVVHMGLPKHVAWLVVQQIHGEWILILYTCGQPKCVCVAIIEDQHIMPGTWGPPHTPRDWLSWSSFEPGWKKWRALHPHHTKVTHIGTCLPVLNDFKFGDEPCGILLGGVRQGRAEEEDAEEDNAAFIWEDMDILLGGGSGAGKCGNSQCEYGCFCPRPGTHFPRGSNDPIPNHANSFEALVVPIVTGEVQVQGMMPDEGVMPADIASSAGVINHSNPTWRDRRAAQIDDWQDLRRLRNSHSRSPSADRRGRKRLQSGTVSPSAVSLRSPSLAMAPSAWFPRSCGLEMAATSVRDGGASLVQDDLVHQDHVSETESDDDDIGLDELKTKFAQTSHGSELEGTYAVAQDGFWVEADLGEAATRVLSKEEQGLGDTLAGNHKRKRELEEIAEVEVMLRTDSPQIKELQPLVSNLKVAIAELKSAFLSGEVVGELTKMSLQKTYLKASNKLCQASVKLCNNKWWPQLFIAAFRASHPGRVDPDVDPVAMEKAFKGLISEAVLEHIVHQATTGEEIYLTGQPESSWAPESATAKEFAREIWSSIWKDASFASSFVFGPDCLPHMALAEVQGYALHRVPKRSTATGLETGAGRLIADLSHKDKRGLSINSMTDAVLYGNFKMARHADIALSVLTLRAWFPKKRIVIAKLDVARAFRRKMLAVSAFGILGFKISGHVVLEQGEVFGHNIAPAIYAFSSEAISQAHRASGIWLTVEELEEAGYEFAEGEEKTPKFVPFFSDTYCDDGILVAPDNERFMKATKASYIGFMKANLGNEAVSMKDLEEQEFRSEKVVIGHRFVLGAKPDARGDVDFLEPTGERILKMKRMMDSEQLTPEGKHLLTAGLCMKLFSLWLWMCIPCPRLKAFIGSFKRALEGQVIVDQSTIVSPVRCGDDPTVAWQQFWSDMLTLKAVLVMHEVSLGFFRVPLFRLLSEDLQQSVYPERFDTVSTDASIIGGGGYCHTGVDAGCYFRILLPSHVRTDMKECMANGHDFNDTTKYTIAIVEKTLHTLGLMVFGKPGGCYVMLQDNQNVVDWVKKGWGKPLRAQVLLRRDVMHGMHLDIWSIIQYISTTRNVLADLLSRSYTERGIDDEEVLNKFRELALELNAQVSEVIISKELTDKLFPPVLDSQDMNSLLDDVLDAERYKLTCVNESSRKLDVDKKTVGANNTRWVSHLDEVVSQNKLWDDVEVGGRNSNTRWSVFKDHDKPVQPPTRNLPEDMVEDTEEEYEIERVLKRRNHPESGVVQYRVKWKDYNHRFNLWKSVEELEQGAEAISDFEALVQERGSIPYTFTDTEADKYYYALQEDFASTAQSVSKGPSVMGGRGFGSRRQEMEAQLPVTKQAWASTLVAADLFKSPIDNRPSSAFNRREGDKGKGKGKNHAYHEQLFPEESKYEPHQHHRWDTHSGGSHNEGLHDFRFSGPSLADKVKANAVRKERRIEVVITREDDRLIQAAARTLAHSLSQNTNRTYANNFELFLGFCVRQNLSPVLNGWDKRKDEDTLIAFILYEFEIHGNKYSTLKIKLSAIRAAMMEEGYANPIEGKYTLARHMKGIKALRGSTDAKEPLPAEAFRNLLISTQGKSLRVRCTALAIAFAFFFLLRVSEFAARDSVYMEKFIALRQDVTFYKKGKLCAWNDVETDAVELFIKGSKTDQRHQGCRRMQHRSGDDTLCPVKCIQEWFGLTYGSAIPASAPLFSIPKGKFGAEWKVLTRDDVTILMKGAAVECNIPSKQVATHSIRISGATALLLANIPPETVQIIGRWTSNTFIGYQRYKAELMGGIANRMINTHYITAPVYPMKNGN